MDIKLKYKAWVGEKHADIAHRLIECDIETFAIEFAENLVKNCFIPVVVEHEVQLCRFCKVGDTNNDFGCTNPKCEMYPFQ